ncbi:MAG: hypothetical protein M1840_006903 [Geoglossum simile]|nr:MAG: hypothetical protein M1840_006903 [Geoglossum simile]
MTNSNILFPGTARHTFESADGMLMMERGYPEWITESLFNDRVRRRFKRQNYVTKFSSAAECDGSNKVSILMALTNWDAILQSARHKNDADAPSDFGSNGTDAALH